jgi:hypothetical protein
MLFEPSHSRRRRPLGRFDGYPLERDIGSAPRQLSACRYGVGVVIALSPTFCTPASSAESVLLYRDAKSPSTIVNSTASTEEV